MDSFVALLILVLARPEFFFVYILFLLFCWCGYCLFLGVNMNALNIEVGTKGCVIFHDEKGNKVKKKSTVIAVYQNHRKQKVFACLIDYGNCQTVVADFDEVGNVRTEFRIVFRFEVAE